MVVENVLISPILTEKTTILRENNCYTLKVDARTNKFEIAKAFKKLFGIEIVSCKIVNVKGKKKAVAARGGHRKGYGQKSSYKKAYVTLKEGDKINLYEN